MAFPKRGLPLVAAALLTFMILGASANGAAPQGFDIETALADGTAVTRIGEPGMEAAPCGHGHAETLTGDTDDRLPSFEGCATGIRPGARMTSPNGCTFNFVFSRGSDRFIGTAGHCVSSVGQRVAANGVGLFGTVVYRNFAGSMDFALIQIDPDKLSLVDPRMCTWGGPDGISPTGGIGGATNVILEYGWGVATQFTAQTRSRGHEEFLSSSGVLSWNGAGSGGDSGAPVIRSDGRAVGIHTWGITPIAGVVLESGPSITAILNTLNNAGWNVQVVNGGSGGI